MIQSVLINKNINTLPSSINYLKKNNLIIDMTPKNFITKNYYRFRQIDPILLKNYKFKIITIDKKKDIKCVMAYK